MSLNSARNTFMTDNRWQVVSMVSFLVVVGLSLPARAEELLKVVPGAHLPQAVSSFGAVGSECWLYVYGGHIAPTHNYSTEAVTGEFQRLKLGTGDQPDGNDWEKLPGGPRVQGMNLAAHAGKIYRAGGME